MQTDRRRINSLEINPVFRRPNVSAIDQSADERDEFGAKILLNTKFIYSILFYIQPISFSETDDSSPVVVLARSSLTR